jgi:hypothetical protein
MLNTGSHYSLTEFKTYRCMHEFGTSELHNIGQGRSMAMVQGNIEHCLLNSIRVLRPSFAPSSLARGTYCTVTYSKEEYKSAWPARYSHFSEMPATRRIYKLLAILVPPPEMPATCSCKLLTCLVPSTSCHRRRKEAGINVMNCRGERGRLTV